MRIFLVHPGFGWASGEISLSVESVLRSLGCEVSSFDPMAGMQLYARAVPAAAASGIRAADDIALRLTCERILLRVAEEKPDLFLAVHGARLPVHIVDAVKSLGIPTAVWLLDDPHEIDLSSRYATHYDWVFTDERMAVPVHKAEGSARTFHLPLGCDTAIHRPCAPGEKYRSDICMVGSGFPERIKLLLSIQEELSEFNVKLVGHWQGLPESSCLKKAVVGGLVPPCEAAKYCSGARIVLNPHRSSDGSGMASNLWKVKAVSPNPRLFEAAACETFVLTDNKRADIGRYFEIGREIDTFSDGAELINKIRYWLGREKERAAGAAAAARRARNDHSLKKRMSELLKITGTAALQSETAGVSA